MQFRLLLLTATLAARVNACESAVGAFNLLRERMILVGTPECRELLRIVSTVEETVKVPAEFTSTV